MCYFASQGDGLVNPMADQVAAALPEGAVGDVETHSGISLNHFHDDIGGVIRPLREAHCAFTT